LGSAVRFRSIRYQGVDEARAAHEAAGRSGEDRASGIPPELQARLSAELLEQHYRKWVDTPVPMLHDLTPRQAAQLKGVRPRLVALLKDMESRAERDGREGRPGYDPGWMWAELGLARPE